MARAAAYTSSAASRVRRSEPSLSAVIAAVVGQELAEDVRQRLIVTLFHLQGRGSQVWLLHLLNHISSASCLRQRRGLLCRPCTGRGSRALPYSQSTRSIPLLRIDTVLLLNKYISLRLPNVICVSVSACRRLRSQLKDGTRHLAHDTSVHVKASSCRRWPRLGQAARVAMAAALRQGSGCNGFKLNC